MNQLLPRITAPEAEALIGRLAGREVLEIASAMPADVPFTCAPVGGVEANASFMRDLRTSVVELASAAGYPGTRKQARLLAFESDCARLLHDRLSIAPHEAGHREVWAGLTAGHLLDVAKWRWGEITDHRRVNGDINRDTFRRLWWRAELLQDPAQPWDGFGGLGEDEIVAITERPIVTGNPEVARSIVRQFRAHLDADPDLPQRMLIMRDAMKRLTRLTPFTSLDVLDRPEIDRMVDGVMREAIAALTSREPVRPHPSETGTAAPTAPAVPAATAEVDKVALGIAARAGTVSVTTLREATGLDASGARGALTALVERGLLTPRGTGSSADYGLGAATSRSDLAPRGRLVGSLRRAIRRE